MVAFTIIRDKMSVLWVEAVLAVATEEAAEAMDTVLVAE